MSTIASIEFARQADNLSPDRQTRSRVVAAAVAAAISRVLPIPSFEAEDPAGHYRLNVSSTANQLLSCINEQVVFDIQFAEPFLRQLWIMRHSAAYPSTKVLDARQFGFFDTIFGVGIYVDDTTHAFLNEHKDSILNLMSVANAVVEEAKNG